MEKLLSRKEAREKLGLSDATFRRKIKELNIECVNEILPNGVTSMKIAYADFLRLSNSVKPKNIEPTNKGASDIAVPFDLKMQLYQTQLGLENALVSIKDKDLVIESLKEDKEKAEEKNDALFKAFTDTNQKYIDAMQQINELQSKLLQEKSKGIFARIFGK